MIKNEVLHAVKEIVADILMMKTDEIGDTALLADVGLSSVELIDVVVKLQMRYQIEFDPATMSNLSCSTLADNVERAMLAGCRDE
ncbi:acyl carrier protein [Paraherbaspirillum soli]|uniref:Acyl carrier protein n=1 Tax=Paraherbaspirillum soli TaxID=631222 RepID=A0ABW0M5P4_9BURK